VTSSSGPDLAGLPTLADARGGETVEGRWRWSDVGYQVASAPVREGLPFLTRGRRGVDDLPHEARTDEAGDDGRGHPRREREAVNDEAGGAQPVRRFHAPREGERAE
jgi:hypothetical protein